MNGITSMQAFRIDAAVRYATEKKKEEYRDEHQQNARTAGTASPQEKKQLHQDQENRANLRESMQQAGKSAPSPEGQLSTLEEMDSEVAQ